MNKGGGKEGDRNSSRVKKQLQRLMEVYTNIGAKYTKIGRGGGLNENVYISYLDDFSMWFF